VPTVASSAAARPARAPASTRWHDDRQLTADMPSTASVTDMSPMPPTDEGAVLDATAADVLNSASVDVDALSSDGNHSEPEDGTSQDVCDDIMGVGG